MSVKDFFKRQFSLPNAKKRMFLMLCGVLAMGYFLSFLICINWGTDPFSFQNSIVSTTIGISFGSLQLILNIILLIVVIIFDRKIIGIGTVANIILIGYTSDFFRWVWSFTKLSEIIFNPNLLPARIALFAVSLFGFCAAAAVYINADMGLSPYDGVANIFGRLLKKLPKAVSRIIYDFIPLVAGILISFIKPVDIKSSLIGSVSMTLLLGPMIQIVGKVLHLTKSDV